VHHNFPIVPTFCLFGIFYLSLTFELTWAPEMTRKLEAHGSVTLDSHETAHTSFEFQSVRFVWKVLWDVADDPTTELTWIDCSTTATSSPALGQSCQIEAPQLVATISYPLRLVLRKIHDMMPLKLLKGYPAAMPASTNKITALLTNCLQHSSYHYFLVRIPQNHTKDNTKRENAASCCRDMVRSMASTSTPCQCPRRDSSRCSYRQLLWQVHDYRFGKSWLWQCFEGYQLQGHCCQGSPSNQLSRSDTSLATQL